MKRSKGKKDILQAILVHWSLVSANSQFLVIIAQEHNLLHVFFGHATENLPE